MESVYNVGIVLVGKRRVSTIPLKQYKWDKNKTDYIPTNRNFQDLTGNRYGKLIAQYPKIHEITKRSVWVCICDCGNNKEIISYSLTSGYTKSCGCNLKKEAIEHHSWTGYEEMNGEFLTHIRLMAKDRNLEFELTNEYMWRLFQDQQKKCKLSGILLEFGRRQKRTASLDRIDSSKGYIEGNVQWVHKDINRMKNHFNNGYFISICKLISENNKGQCEI